MLDVSSCIPNRGQGIPLEICVARPQRDEQGIQDELKNLWGSRYRLLNRGGDSVDDFQVLSVNFCE